MIKDCEAHKIDMVITKSISRFARNTQDCLENYRKLKNLGITLIFEKENINSADTTGELLLTILSSLAQDESRNISENCKWGIRSKFQKGIPHINTFKFMGYDKDAETGRLVINEEQAKLVRRIYKEFMEGFTPGVIASRLNAEGIPGVSGEPKWLAQTIRGMLHNEKHMGDSLLQKSYTADFLTRRQVKNDGEINQYYVEDSHDGIISKDYWNAVQQEFERRENYMAEHHLSHFGYGNEMRPFNAKIICGKCGATYGRKSRHDYTYVFWQCYTRCMKGIKTCTGDNVREETIHKAFLAAWNKAVRQKDKLSKRWDEMEQNGTELQRFRAKQMRELVGEGELKEIVPELVQTVLECMVVKENGAFEVRFLDGTKYEIKF